MAKDTPLPAAGQDRHEGSISYSAATESAETKDTAKELAPFTQRVRREAVRRGYDRAVRKVAIGDGAPWRWNVVAEFYDDAIEILDKFHAKEHLHAVASDVFGAKSNAGKQWSAARCEEIDRGQTQLLFAAVGVHALKSDEARKAVGYHITNQHRMDYPRFEAMGLCVGSGVVEAGCKTAIGVRMNRAGVHWTLRGVNAIAALRCCRVSGRYEEFMEWWAEQKRAA